MKRFYMILAALLIGSVCFAQKTMTLTEKTLASQNNQTRATGWYGESTLAGYQDLTAGGYFILRPETYPGATTAGEQVEKIKFYVVSPSQLQGTAATTYASYTNLSFTIKIYEGSAMNADLLDVETGYTTDNAAVLGTLVRTIPYTGTQAGEQVVELSEPYTIGNSNYWITIESNGNSLIAGNYTQISNTVTPAEYQGGTSPTISLSDYSGVHYLLYEVDEYEDIDVPVSLSYTDATSTAIAVYLMDAYFQIYVQGSGAYVENSDISAGFMDVYPNPTNDNLTSLTIAATADLHIYPYIMNNGPDAVHPTEAVNVSFTVNGVDPYGQAIPMQWSSDFSAGYFSPIQMSETEYGLTFTAADLDAAGLPAEFDVCVTATFTGVDNNSANNTACLHVTRQAVAVEENIAASVSVYPNPANDMFTVANAEGATIVVVNSLGQVVSSIENAASNQTIDASNFANGTYFVKVNESVIKINVVK